MPQTNIWYCSHCQQGLMTCGIDLHCAWCSKRIDGYAIYGKTTNSASYSSEGILGERYPEGSFGSRLLPYPYHLDTTHVNDCSGEYYYAIREVKPASTVPTLPPIYQPATYGPAQFWWCCHCKDGPKSTTLEPRCVACQHSACSYCPRK